MPLRKSSSHSDGFTSKNAAPSPSASPPVDSQNGSLTPATQQSRIEAMKIRSRSASGSPRELVKLRTFRLNTLSETPKITFDDVEPRLHLSQLNPSPDTPPHEFIPNGTEIAQSSPAALARSVTMSPVESPPSESLQWSSAIGHASTGKSGRVIERLQAEKDKLARDQHLFKVQIEEAEKNKEIAQAQIAYLQDRNSNLEQSHEANSRQLNRRDRKIEELRTDLQKEKERTSRAENSAKGALQSEEEALTKAKRAEAVASQSNHEYETIKKIRDRDKNDYQIQVNKIRENFSELLNNRKEDQKALEQLKIMAEQQKHTIRQLEEDNRKTDQKFHEYRDQVDSLFTNLRGKCGINGQQIAAALEESQGVLGKMKWVMNVHRDKRKGTESETEASVQEEE